MLWEVVVGLSWINLYIMIFVCFFLRELVLNFVVFCRILVDSVEFVIKVFMDLRFWFLILLFFDRRIDIIFRLEFLLFLFVYCWELEVKLVNKFGGIVVGNVVKSGMFVV